MNMLSPPIVIVPLNSGKTFTMSVDTMASLLDNYYDSPTTCSLISYFVRAERPHDLQPFLQERWASIDKEITAALHFQSHQQVLNYTQVFGNGVEPLHSSLRGFGSTTFRLLRLGLQRIIREFSQSDSEILFPYYNVKKNVSYATQERYHIVHGIDPSAADYNVTSADLLKYYYHTGNRIGGPMEVRTRWGFGDLKPRTYYCMGGDAYWAGLYAQPIANLFAKILPSTHPFTRFDISRLGEVSSNEFVITYDYTSFTTSLEELKFLIFYLANALSGTTVTVLDVCDGIMEIDLEAYLQDYNDICNIHQAIDLRRIFRDDEITVLYQGRNGSLGCQGNIVFSMFLHGILLGTLTGTPERDSCVGDDALARILKPFLDLFISSVNLLGDINPTKFTTLVRPPDDDPTLANRQQYKYLKRPITVDFTGKVLQGYLDFFPNVADVLFPEGDGVHQSSVLKDVRSSLRTFCTQWGQYLTMHTTSGYPLESPELEIDVLLASIQVVYRKYSIPQEGAVPGYTAHYVHEKFSQRFSLDFFAPPCDDTSVFHEDWLDRLGQLYGNELIPQPVLVGGVIPPDMDARPGSRFTATLGHPLVRILEVLGCFEVNRMVQFVEFDEGLRDRLRVSFAGHVKEEILAEIVVLDVPPWYLDVMLRLHPDFYFKDSLEKLEEITSVFSGSEILSQN